MQEKYRSQTCFSIVCRRSRFNYRCRLHTEQGTENFAARYVTAQTAIPPSRNCQSAFVFRIRIQLAAAGISINKDMAQKYIASLPVSSRKPAAKP